MGSNKLKLSVAAVAASAAKSATKDCLTLNLLLAGARSLVPHLPDPQARRALCSPLSSRVYETLTPCF